MAKLDAQLMPSAVAPSPDTPFQALVVPTIRLRQTVAAVKYWVRRANKFDFRILVADNTNFAQQINEKCDENLYVDYSIRNTECAYQGVNYSSEIKDQSGVTRSKASPFNEFRIVRTVLRTRKASRKLLSFVKPGYQKSDSI